MRRHYCTLFDRRYLAKGLAMMDSVYAHSSKDVRIHVLALDDETENVLRDRRREGVTSLAALEHAMDLAPVRDSRTWQEYCWTLASVWSAQLMKINHDEVTYLDADLFFFGDPEQVFSELGDRAIAVTPHRHPRSTIARFEDNGRFNVSWVTFRGEVGRQCAASWADQCREWCYYRHEGGKFGDQKYLDAWPELYGKDLCEIENIGAGVAPWNVAKYDVTDGPKVDGVPVVFYHFHEYEHGKVLTNHPLPDGARRFIYRPYSEAIESFSEVQAR